MRETLFFNILPWALEAGRSAIGVGAPNKSCH